MAVPQACALTLYPDCSRLLSQLSSWWSARMPESVSETLSSAESVENRWPAGALQAKGRQIASSPLWSGFGFLTQPGGFGEDCRVRIISLSWILMLLPWCWNALAQSGPASDERKPQPLYEVTIVSRTTKALNYGYLTAPTRIDFRGTAVLPEARGEAIVQAKRGATLLKLRFDRVPAPNRFGPEFLTYVVWAITPEGRAQNLGELGLDGSDKGKLTVSTPLQTFAMIVTAEPYYAVTQPSDVVVMENVVGRGTIGKVQEVNATYELLPRRPFTFEPGKQPKGGGPPVSREQYEAITALYQALNAIQIAQSQGADRYAPDRMSRARELYEQARGYPTSLSKEIVSIAREATQVAEDSRAIAIKRAASEKSAEDQKPVTGAR